MARLAPLTALVLAVVTLGGCGGSDEAANDTTTDATANTTQEPSPPWTEFGATVDDWDSAHERDTKYASEGCCYLPGPLSAGGRYAALLSDEYRGTLRVSAFSIRWDEPIPLALAREVVRDAAPPGARLAFSVRKRGCVMAQYRSPAPTLALYEGAVMLAAAYSPGRLPFNGTVDDVTFVSVGGDVDC